MSPSAAQSSRRCLPRRFLGKNGLPLEIRRFPGDCPDFRTTGDCPNFHRSENGTVPFAPAVDAAPGQPLIDMYLAYQPRNSFQGLPPIKDEVCIRWVRDILATGIHVVAVRSAGVPPAFRSEGETPALQNPAGVPLLRRSSARAAGHSPMTDKPLLAPAPLADSASIIGHAALFPVNADKCEMLVVVCPGFQNVGIGTELVRSCIDLAAELGFQQIWLPVDSTNVRARHVYRKCGFEYVSGKQGRELDMTCDVRRSRPATIYDLHGPARQVPAPCFSFPELPHVSVQR
jgi:hypothetical protein